MSAMYAVHPTSLKGPAIALSRSVGNCCNAISGSTMTIAALTDCCQGDGALLAETLGRFTGYAGLGVVVGPAIGAWVLARTNENDKAVLLGFKPFGM